MNRTHVSLVLTALAYSLTGWAQDAPSSDPKQATRQIRDLQKQGEDGIPGIAAFAPHPALEVRLEAVKRLGEIGGPRTLEAMLAFARDNDPEIQIWAIEGLVNIYLPGYLKTGISRSLSRAGDAVKAKFGDEGNDQVVDTYINVDPRVIQAIARLVGGSPSWEGRATGARALGVLRGQAGIPELVEALYSKNDDLIFEALIAMQKIRDPLAGPKLAFLVRDLDPKIQVAALQAAGILRAGGALEDIRKVIAEMPAKQIEREALTALAMIADPADRMLFLSYLANRDAGLRAAAAEGLARLNDPQDLMALETAFTNERESNPRVSLAFAVAAHGKRELSQFSALQYLVSTLNRRAYRNVALAFLTELTRDARVRQALYPALTGASKEEKLGLAIALGRSGDRDAVPYLDALRNESDPDVAQAGLNGLRAISARTRP